MLGSLQTGMGARDKPVSAYMLPTAKPIQGKIATPQYTQNKNHNTFHCLSVTVQVQPKKISSLGGSAYGGNHR